MGTGKTPTRTVLIVDDEPLIRWSLGERLAREGYGILEAPDGKTALQHFDGSGAGSVDLVLLDLRLPDSHDMGILEGIRRKAPCCPVIMMTAYGRPDTIAQADELGAYQVIDKPFDVERIVALVSEALAGQVS